MIAVQNPNLIDDPSHEQPDLHEHKVRGGVEVGQVGEGEVVVKAVEEGGDHVVAEHHGMGVQV